jgi:hypothetical protein
MTDFTFGDTCQKDGEEVNITAFHAKYFAHDLTRRCASDNIEKPAAVLSDAQVDLNPHQIEAALFAFRNPFSHGAMRSGATMMKPAVQSTSRKTRYWMKSAIGWDRKPNRQRFSLYDGGSCKEKRGVTVWP